MAMPGPSPDKLLRHRAIPAVPFDLLARCYATLSYSTHRYRSLDGTGTVKPCIQRRTVSTSPSNRPHRHTSCGQ